VANKDSIGWGIAKRLHHEGATILFSYAAAALEKRVRPLAAEVGSDFVELCDVSDDAQLDAVFEKVKERYGRIDVLVHSVAFAPREDLGGRFLDISREGFKVALDISAYSLVAMCKRAEPLMQPGSTVLSLTYNASQRVMPKYNVMAIAKSALENISRYLAADLGPKGIRVNVISAGPIKTLAAMGVPGIHAISAPQQRHAG
jgi:enoyl-[acyl-carrier protein] reductase I